MSNSPDMHDSHDTVLPTINSDNDQDSTDTSSPSPSSQSTTTSDTNSEHSTDSNSEDSESSSTRAAAPSATDAASTLRSRLSSFLPRLAAANRDLAAQAEESGTRKRKRADAFEITAPDGTDQGGLDGASGATLEHAGESADEKDDSEEEEGKVYIEMDLGLGVLEERRGEVDGVKLRRSSSSVSELSEETSGGASDDEEGNRDSSVMERLLAVRQTSPPRKKHRVTNCARAHILEVPDD